MNYSVAIRTLGRAGSFYQKTLDSLKAQTLQPEKIVVYIAEGYEIPKETIGREQYVFVKKGMVAQRALQYQEIDSEYILFLDDDVFLPENAVAKLFEELNEYNGDVIAPATFANHKVSLKKKIRLTLSGKEVCRPFGQKWGYKVLRTAGFSYNNNPIKPVYQSQTNAGNCFLCKKNDFLDIHFEKELWLDETPYSLPEDQVMFYKMHISGMKVLTSFDSGIIHLDAGSTIGDNPERESNIIYSETRNKLIFWHKFIYARAGIIGKTLSTIGLSYYLLYRYIPLLLKNSERKTSISKGISSAKQYICNTHSPIE